MTQQSPLEKFIEHLKTEKEMSENTVATYSSQLRGYLRFLAEQGISLYSVSKENIVHYLGFKKAAGYKASSRFVAVISIKLFHRFLLTHSHVTVDPSIKVELPRLDEKLPKIFSIEQVERILNLPVGGKFNRVRNQAMVELLYATGIRVSELINLKLPDLNLGECWIRVIGKGRKERPVPFGPTAQKAIAEYLIQRNERFLSATDVLFVNSRGKMLSRAGFWWILKRMAKRAGLRDPAYPHKFRHSCVTHMLWRGASLKALQEMLGHKNLSTTEIYTHVTPEFLRATFQAAHPRV